MRTFTNKFVGHCLFFVTALSVTLLIFSFCFNEKNQYDDISSEDNFKELVKTENSLLLFSSQSRDSLKLDELWKSLARTLSEDFSNVHVAKFDCSVFKPICEGIGVYEYPTIAWMKKGEIAQRYQGTHDEQSLQAFVFEMLQPPKPTVISSSDEAAGKPSEEASKEEKNSPEVTSSESESDDKETDVKTEKKVSSEVEKEPEDKQEDKSETSEETSEQTVAAGNDEDTSAQNQNSTETVEESNEADQNETKPLPTLVKHFVMKSKPKLMELSASNFTDNLNSDGVTLVMLYAPWCTFCSELRGILKKVAMKNGLNPAITIGEINCDATENRDLCADQDIQGVPTLNLYRNGDILLHDYKGTTLEELDDCVVSHLNDKEIKKWRRRESKRKLSPPADKVEFVKETLES